MTLQIRSFTNHLRPVVTSFLAGGAMAAVVSMSAPAASFAPATTTAADAAPEYGPVSHEPLPAVVDEDGDWVGGDDAGNTSSDWHGAPARPELYATQPSVLPGESIDVCVSTPAARYTIEVLRLGVDADDGSREITNRHVDGRPGRDQRGRITVDAAHTARANWLVTDTISTKGFAPGVYAVKVSDSNGWHAYGLVVVRTPRISAAAPLFIVPVLTYQAYNIWGGSSFYTTHTPVRTWRLSFDRPYVSGTGIFRNTHEDDLIGWLAAEVPGLQYTTDYDLSLAPPTTFPSYAILGRHTEYVPMAMFDWLVEGVQTRGVMGLVNFGANSLYWQVRLEPATVGANRGNLEIVCYKNDSLKGYPKDPVKGPETSARWRDPLVGRPEGAFMGAQFTALLRSAKSWPGIVTADAPAWLLDGTDLVSGASAIARYMTGEADVAYLDGPVGSTTTTVIVSTPTSGGGITTAAGATIRTFASGGRIFNASTFGIVQLLQTDATARTLTRNVLSWAAGSQPGANR